MKENDFVVEGDSEEVRFARHRIVSVRTGKDGLELALENSRDDLWERGVDISRLDEVGYAWISRRHEGTKKPTRLVLASMLYQGKLPENHVEIGPNTERIIVKAEPHFWSEHREQPDKVSWYLEQETEFN